MTGPVRRRRRFPFGSLLVICELVVYILVARWIGIGWTILLTLVTGFAGASLMRYFGAKAFRAYAEDAREGRPPGRTIVDGTIAFVGAIGLLVPGFISDVLGLLCVFPPTRALLRPLAERLLASRLPSGQMGAMFGPRRVRTEAGMPDESGPHDVIDGEVLEGEIVDGPREDNEGPRSPK
ncbi:membrane protein [Actinorhabdospora filicis]|uniref:Membrane protein n=1 Tax=Actinorhabdospora filicis TaxID=1785913 RepID=A0A9W6SKW2_9ACTN|nr:FxsA family protein [Actinorhabdospora filicis]GLZ78869.1 membrane protein [Actinorhabdospora filicis]